MNFDIRLVDLDVRITRLEQLAVKLEKRRLFANIRFIVLGAALYGLGQLLASII